MIIDQLAATVILCFLICFGVSCTRFTILKTVTGRKRQRVEKTYGRNRILGYFFGLSKGVTSAKSFQKITRDGECAISLSYFLISYKFSTKICAESSRTAQKVQIQREGLLRVISAA